MTSKRTRLLYTKQSKYGCITCKARRVKCDEQKPSCGRCIRAGRVCEGYPSGAPSDQQMIESPDSGQSQRDSVSPITIPEYGLTDRVQCSTSQVRLAQLACTVLGNHPFVMPNTLETAFWTYLLPQFGYAIPSVNAALATFGAYFEAQIMHGLPSAKLPACTQQYATALKLLQQDVESLPHGPLPLVTSCMLLAAAQTIPRHFEHALIHIGGASRILSMRNRGQYLTAGSTTQQFDSPSPRIQDEFDSIISVFQTMDVHVSTYTAHAKLDLPVSYAQEPLPEFSSLAHASSELMKILHTCYHFVDACLAYRHNKETAERSRLLTEQAYHISRLRSWLNKVKESDFLHQGHSSITDEQLSQPKRHLSLLKAQCLSTVVIVSTILSSFRICSDQFSAEFEEILECAEIVLDDVNWNNQTSSRSSIPLYSIFPGIIGPLDMTAWEYRHSVGRRKAIRLLRRAGLEGPWNGPLDATVVSRIIEIEEGRPLDLQSTSLKLLLPSDIPNSKRVCHIQWVTNFGENEDNLDEAVVKFLRLRDLDGGDCEELQDHDEKFWEAIQEKLYFHPSRQ